MLYNCLDSLMSLRSNELFSPIDLTGWGWGWESVDFVNGGGEAEGVKSLKVLTVEV